MQILSTIERFGTEHQIVEHAGRFAYVKLDSRNGQLTSPNYGSGDHTAVFARGTSDRAYEIVAFWCARSTADKRRRAAMPSL